MILNSILCAVDFSEQSRDALRWARVFAARFQSRLTVLTVVEPLLSDAAKIRLGQDLVKVTDAALRDFVAATGASDAAAEHITFSTLVGDPAGTILATASNEPVDLLVVGTQGLGGIRKWLLGSTTERVLRRTRVPVLAVPRPHEESSVMHADDERYAIARILAAVDFSASSLTALDVATRIAERFSATVTLAHAVSSLAVPPHIASLLNEANDARVEDAQRRLEAVATPPHGTPSHEQVVSTGSPAETIAAVAKERRSQLIVMGLASEHDHRVPRPGSVAYRVLCSTAVPVLVVPAPDAVSP